MKNKCIRHGLQWDFDSDCPHCQREEYEGRFQAECYRRAEERYRQHIIELNNTILELQSHTKPDSGKFTREDIFNLINNQEYRSDKRMVTTRFTTMFVHSFGDECKEAIYKLADAIMALLKGEKG